MLKIPCIRQTSEVSCLPTCIRAVLAYHGYRLSDEEAMEVCGTERAGTSAELAVQGLADVGLDAELCEFQGIDDLCDLVNDDRPVVVFIWHPSGASHAVVVCDVMDAEVTVMDPAVGEFRRLPMAQFQAMWYNPENGGMVIGRVVPPSPAAADPS